jgi:hypothetical protein
MKKYLFTVYDSKSGVYGAPTEFVSKGVAIRSFSEVANNPETQFGKYPEDFILFLIAEYEDTTGEVIPRIPHETIGKAIEFIVKN